MNKNKEIQQQIFRILPKEELTEHDLSHRIYGCQVAAIQDYTLLVEKDKK